MQDVKTSDWSDWSTFNGYILYESNINTAFLHEYVLQLYKIVIIVMIF